MTSLIYCAAELTDYRGPMPGSGLPLVTWEQRAVTADECQRALKTTAAHWPAGTQCFAVTKHKGAGLFTLVMPYDAKPWVRKTEALRIVNRLRGVRLPPAEVYAQARKPWRCDQPVGPGAVAPLSPTENQ